MLLKLRNNGDPVGVNVKSGDRLLLDVLREDLKLTGTKVGCGLGACCDSSSYGPIGWQTHNG